MLGTQLPLTTATTKLEYTVSTNIWVFQKVLEVVILSVYQSHCVWWLPTPDTKLERLG